MPHVRLEEHLRPGSPHYERHLAAHRAREEARKGSPPDALITTDGRLLPDAINRLRALFPVPVKWEIVDKFPATRRAVLDPQTGDEDPWTLSDRIGVMPHRPDITGHLRSSRCGTSVACWVEVRTKAGKVQPFYRTMFWDRTSVENHNYPALEALVEGEMMKAAQKYRPVEGEESARNGSDPT